MTALSEHFTLREATKSATAIRLGIDNTPPDDVIPKMKAVAERILEPCRAHFATPFTPTSFYRCLALNRELGSSDDSQHVKGEAVDFEIPGLPNLKLARWIADNLLFDQVILEFYSPVDPAAGWVHCSYADGKNRGEVLTYSNRHFTKGFPTS